MFGLEFLFDEDCLSFDQHATQNPEATIKPSIVVNCNPVNCTIKAISWGKQIKIHLSKERTEHVTCKDDLFPPDRANREVYYQTKISNNIFLLWFCFLRCENLFWNFLGYLRFELLVGQKQDVSDSILRSLMLWFVWHVIDQKNN